MTADPLARINTRRTPQSEQADPRQVRNAAGGYGFVIDDMDRLDRFLITGTAGGTFYVGEKELTKQNTDFVLDLSRTRTRELVDRVVEISTAGRALRQQPTLFTLAAAAGLGPTPEDRAYALDRLEDVARTGTMLKQFVTYVEQFRGWGPALRRAVGRWYTGRNVPAPGQFTDDADLGEVVDTVNTRPVSNVAFQVTKYRTRLGWSDKDLLRLSHGSQSTRNGSKNVSPGTNLEESRKALFDWIAGREVDLSAHEDLRVVEGFERVQRAETDKQAAALIQEYGLVWEHVPDRYLNSPVVLEALLDAGMPQGALIRQLPRLTNAGLLTPLKGSWTQRVAEMLVDPLRLKRARIHPVAILIAAKTYESGHGAQGRSVWTPSLPIVDALNDAFYPAYGAVEPTGKRVMCTIDVSGSMGGRVNGVPNLSCREAAAAFVLASANIETNYMITAFSSAGDRGRMYNQGRQRHRVADGITPLAISPRQRLTDAVRTIGGLPFGGTDCALPMRYALGEGLEVDAFVMKTDNESWAGDIHPHQALREYREQTGINAKFIVAAMSSTHYSVADPADPLSMDIVGMDGDVPSLISSFVKGV